MQVSRPESKVTRGEDAKKVFEGEIFDVYQWQQEMFDGSFETFEQLARVDTVVVIPVLENGKIMVTLQEQPSKPPFRGLAGGRLEPGEKPVAGAKREMLEETGLASDNFELLFATQPVSKIDWAIYTFVARDCKKVAELNLDVGEKIELEELSFDEFIDFATDSSCEDVHLSLYIFRLINAGKLESFREKLFGS